MRAKEGLRTNKDAVGRPILMIDVDGVISLFGAPAPPTAATVAPARAGTEGQPDGSFHSIEGIPHFLSAAAVAHLHSLAPLFDLVWASGWEERADEHLPHLVGAPAGLPFLRFSRAVGGRGGARAHWKIDAIDAYAGTRALAWVDDALDDACREWAQGRGAPTLLVRTLPEVGLTAPQAQLLADWARSLPAG
jgi:hypothetical protein